MEKKEGSEASSTGGVRVDRPVRPGMRWVECPEMPPDRVLPNGDSCVVIAHWAPGKIDEGLCQAMVCNTAWFRTHWREAGFSHWALLTDPNA